MKYNIISFFIFLTVGIVIVHLPVHSQWTTNPYQNTPITTAPYSQYLSGIISDGEGGAIITWSGWTGESNNIYAQRIDSAGYTLWTSNGVMITDESADQFSPVLVSDGANGAIIAWEDNRSGPPIIYAQRVDKYGAVQWETNGLPVASSWIYQLNPAIVSDDSGGAIIVWTDLRNGDHYDIYAQRISGSGDLIWDIEGIPISAKSGNQEYPDIVSDGAGGAIIAWECDSVAGLGYNIFAKRINSSGATIWGIQGYPVVIDSFNQSDPHIISDGAHGAIIVWIDYRSGFNWDIYAQRINDTGGVVWATNGIPIVTDTENQYEVDLASDNSGGAIITWKDIRNTLDYDIYAQRVNPDGIVQWPTNGVGIATIENEQSEPAITNDTQGGAIICWYDRRGSELASDIYAQRINDNGNTLWTPNGVAITSNAVYYNYNPMIISDGGNGAIMAFRRSPGEGDNDIYAQRVMGNGVFPMGSISGIKFFDVNYNSVKEGFEPGIPLWNIYLNGPVNDTTITDLGGMYTFDSLVTGIYTVREEIKSGWESTYPPGDTFAIYLSSNENAIELNFGNFIPAILSGSVWNDLNANGYRDPSDTLLPGWLVGVRNVLGGLTDTIVSDPGGNYTVPFLDVGTYNISLIGDDQWIQTYPSGLGEYTVEIGGITPVAGIDFGVVYGYRYVGPGTGNWSDSLNWTGNKPPGSTDNIIIPADAEVTVDLLPIDTVRSVRVKLGGKLAFTPGVGRLKVTGKVRVDEGGLLNFPTTTGPNGLICYNDFINRGTFNIGNSLITLTGDLPKVIASKPEVLNNFYQLEIQGGEVVTQGNVIIKNKLFLNSDLTLGARDTLVIDINDTSAIEAAGKVINGTVKRKIASGPTGRYRFESPSSYVKFSGTGVNPTSLSMKVIPPSAGGHFHWEYVGGVVDTVNNVITIDTVKKFSKWPFGIPKPTVNIMNEANGLEKINFIDRSYYIDAEGGDNYTAEMSLHYNQSDVPYFMEESELALWRGPFLVDTPRCGWNMLAMSLVPENPQVSVVFPSAISPAFAYEGGYVERTTIQFGEGYWLKYPCEAEIAIEGTDQISGFIPVQAGWNLIGTISYPLPSAAVMSLPPAIINSMFFGYSSAYFIEDTLKPLQAYWVKVEESGELFLSVNEGEGGYEKISMDRFNRFIIRDGADQEGVLYFTGKPEIDISRYELPPEPPAGVFNVSYSTGRILEASLNKYDNRCRIQINSATYPVTLSWIITDRSAPSVLLIGDDEHTLASNGEVLVADSTLKIFLIIPPHTANVIPEEFALEQNYPNPFNPRTTIEYQLPVDCRVTIKVYNLLGQAVQTLVDEVQRAGYRKIDWDAGEYASGVYFYRMDAVGDSRQYTQVRKFIFIK